MLLTYGVPALLSHNCIKFMEQGDMQSSKLPMYQGSKDNLASKPMDNGKKTFVPKLELNKELPVLFNFASKSQNGAVFKAQNTAANQRKKPSTYAARGPAARLKLEAELRDKNQLLEAANHQLIENLSEAKENIGELLEKNTKLEGNSNELQKQLETCMLYLETSNIDPVSGGRILESAQQNEEQRKETMSLVQDLKNELEQFSRNAAIQRAQLQELNNKGRILKEERGSCLQEQGDFQADLENMQKELEEAQTLLETKNAVNVQYL
ncbi:small kinetochore-associated protein-like isoform X2 [Acipenser ruthenus]|uniref:small kinetochore-associated protein-like isoform X2 n=2 Tax=Acipenser ruthenus TaxID=7906 RepID=UPI002740BE47|nr:small kinetochore-associated protein-like isoform X2 [Acipenser ruthenus]